MYPLTVLAFILLAAAAIAPVTYFAATPYELPPEVQALETGQMQASQVAALNRDPHYFSVMPPPTAEPRDASLSAEIPAAELPSDGPSAAETSATPNHDPHRVHSVASYAPNPASLSLETLRAEPEEAAAAAAPAFVDADTMLYAKDSARLRAGPSTAAEVLAKLAADAPLRATAHSTDGAWWRVSLDGGRTGYVHRLAVTKDRIVKAEPSAAPASAIAAVPPPPAPAYGREGLRGYADEAMDWFSDTARRGSAPTIIRTER